FSVKPTSVDAVVAVPSVAAMIILAPLPVVTIAGLPMNPPSCGLWAADTKLQARLSSATLGLDTVAPWVTVGNGDQRDDDDVGPGSVDAPRPRPLKPHCFQPAPL